MFVSDIVLPISVGVIKGTRNHEYFICIASCHNIINPGL